MNIKFTFPKTGKTELLFCVKNKETQKKKKTPNYSDPFSK